MWFSDSLRLHPHPFVLALRMSRPGFLVITAVGCLIGMAARTSAAPVVAVSLVLLASGLVLARGQVLLVSSWFGATGRLWRADALADQQFSGWLLAGWAVLWGAGAVAARRAAASPAPLRPE